MCAEWGASRVEFNKMMKDDQKFERKYIKQTFKRHVFKELLQRHMAKYVFAELIDVVQHPLLTKLSFCY